MVVTSCPSTSDIDVMQDRIACLSTITVQAPHSASPQPNLVPVSPTSSRKYQSSERLGSPSQFCSCPLTLSLTIVASWLSLWTCWERSMRTGYIHSSASLLTEAISAGQSLRLVTWPGAGSDVGRPDSIAGTIGIVCKPRPPSVRPPPDTLLAFCGCRIY